MLEWKQNSYHRKHKQCPRCLTFLENGICPRCGWPDFKLPKGITQEQWEIYEEREKERRKIQKVKNNAQKALRKAVQEGKIIKPIRCECCGMKGKLEAHHPSYLQEHWLKIVWLCVECHRKHQDYSDDNLTKKLTTEMVDKIIYNIRHEKLLENFLDKEIKKLENLQYNTLVNDKLDHNGFVQNKTEQFLRDSYKRFRYKFSGDDKLKKEGYKSYKEGILKLLSATKKLKELNE